MDHGCGRCGVADSFSPFFLVGSLNTLGFDYCFLSHTTTHVKHFTKAPWDEWKVIFCCSRRWCNVHENRCFSLAGFVSEMVIVGGAWFLLIAIYIIYFIVFVDFDMMDIPCYVGVRLYALFIFFSYCQRCHVLLHERWVTYHISFWWSTRIFTGSFLFGLLHGVSFLFPTLLETWLVKWVLLCVHVHGT